MPSELTASLVRILWPNGTTAGAGFVVSADGLIVTCSHVVQNDRSQGRGDPRPDAVEVVLRSTGQRLTADVVPEGWRPFNLGDVAFLRIRGEVPTDLLPVQLGSAAGTSGHPFRAFGFPEGKSTQGMWGYGRIGDAVLAENGIEVLQLADSSEVTAGFSGGPVLDESRRAVVGMVSAITQVDRFGRGSETVFATPTEALRATWPDLEWSEVCPYRGLDPFEEKHAEFFFGRERSMEKLLASLVGHPRCLAVLGPSGSGKSSVVLSGLVPALRAGRLPGSERWDFVVVRRYDAPLRQLEAVGLPGAPDSVLDAVTAWLGQNPDATRLVLVLDQFEEVFTSCAESERARILEELGGLIEGPVAATVLLTMRDEFYHRLAAEAPTLVQGWLLVQVPAELTREDLEKIVEQPPTLVGLRFDDGLVKLIVDDALRSDPIGAGEGDAARSTVLPLLEFLLTQLWRRSEDGALTRQAYDDLRGVTGALTEWAEQAYLDLDRSGHGRLARRVLLDLVHLGDEGRGVPDARQRRLLSELRRTEDEAPEVDPVVQRLADDRLVVTTGDIQNEGVTVDLVHDAVIREWHRLRDWLEKERGFRLWLQATEARAASWGLSPDPDEGKLLRGGELAEARRWLKERRDDLRQPERKFIKASINRYRITTGSLFAIGLVTLLVLSTLSWTWWDQRNQAREQAAAALSRQLALQSLDAPAGDLGLAQLLAVEAVDADDSLGARHALLRSLLTTPGAKTWLRGDHVDAIIEASFAPSGRDLIVSGGCLEPPPFDAPCEKGAIRFWSATTFRPLGDPLPAGDGPIYTLAFTDDGSRLISVSVFGTITLWDADLRKELDQQPAASLPYAASWVTAAFRPATRTVAVGGCTTNDSGTCQSGFVRRWDASGDVLRELSELPLQEVVASETDSGLWWDQSLFVAFGLGGTELMVVGMVAGCEQADSGESCASAKVGIFDAETLEPREPLPVGDEGAIQHLAVSPDSTRLALQTGNGEVKVFDLATKELLNWTCSSEVSALALDSHDSLAMANDNGSFTVQDVSLRTYVNSGGNPGDPTTGGAEPSSPHEVAYCDDTDPRTEMTDPRGSVGILGLTFSPDGAALVSTNGTDAIVWDVSEEGAATDYQAIGHAVKTPTRTDSSIVGLAVSPDGQTLAVASDDGNVDLWSVPNRQPTSERLAGLPGRSLAIVYAPNGHLIEAAVGNAQGSEVIFVKDLSEDDTPRSIGVGLSRFDRIMLSPDGKTLGAGSCEPYQEPYQTESSCNLVDVRLWDSESGDPIGSVYRLQASTEGWSFAFSPDSKTLVMGGCAEAVVGAQWCNKGRIHLLDTQNPEQSARTFDAHQAPIVSLAFAPDGTLATGDDYGTVMRWRLPDFERIGSRIAAGGGDGNKHPLGQLAYSPTDGSVLAAHTETSLTLWDTAGSQVLGLPLGVIEPLSVFTPDGKSIISATSSIYGASGSIVPGIDSHIVFWDLDVDEWRSEACKRANRKLTPEEWTRFLGDRTHDETCPGSS